LKLLIDLHYLPCLEYFCVLQQFEAIELEKQEHFVKQSYRNRCYINTAHGVERLVVPLTSKHGKPLIHEVRIDYTTKWQNNHWRAIESAYRKAPYFEFFSPDLHRLLFTPYEFLFDLNQSLLSFCLASLRLSPALSVSVAYEKDPTGVIDLRSVISPKKNYHTRSFYKPAPYYQVFGNGFAENLSLIDLLFCLGPQAPVQLRKSQNAILNN
jgi:hypothetical protein